MPIQNKRANNECNIPVECVFWCFHSQAQILEFQRLRCYRGFKSFLTRFLLSILLVFNLQQNVLAKQKTINVKQNNFFIRLLCVKH